MTDRDGYPGGEEEDDSHGGDDAETPLPVARRRGRAWLYVAVAAGIVILILIAVGGGLVAVDNSAKATKEQTFAVSGVPRLLVSSDIGGGIQVRSGSDNAVHVQAQLRGANRIDFNISQSGDTVDVAARRSGWLNWLGGARKADIVVTTPRRSLVELDGANSRIDLQGIEGAATLHTSNADLRVANVTGPVDASSSNGSIQADGVHGTVKLRTSNGSIRLTEMSGSFDAQTSNGSITFSGTPAAQSSSRLKTSNGSVTVTLQGTPSVRVQASTSNGKVTSKLPITATSTGNDHLSGTIGNGEATLSLQTSNGSITIQ